MLFNNGLDASQSVSHPNQIHSC